MGGRLEEELTYTRTVIGTGSEITNQIVIQTPKSGNNILRHNELGYIVNNEPGYGK